MTMQVSKFAVPFLFSLIACEYDVEGDDVSDEIGDVGEDQISVDSLASSLPLISFDDYKAYHSVPSSDGTWIVEGDIEVPNEQAVREYYDKRILGKGMIECEDPEMCPRSTVATTSGRDDVWNVHEKLSIGYCIDMDGNTEKYDRVRVALEKATSDWERTADINFVHVTAADGDGCAVGSNGVRLRVDRKTTCSSSTQYGAATFPSTTPGRFYYCDPYAFTLNDAGLLRATRHELGHVLGLHHEHNRWAQDDSACLVQINDPRRNLTYADSFSIMGYDFCNGMNEGISEISRGDRLGVHRLYNIAKGHGRLAGTWYEQANSFRGVGVSDDIMWYTPKTGGYQIWSTSTSTGTSTTPISFTKGVVGSGIGDEYSRPLALQWHNGLDANFDREVVLFAPGGLTDKILTNNSNGSFGAQSVVINGYSIPLTGKFHDGTYSEILWWNPGGGSLLWRTDGSNNITQTTATTTYDGGTQALDFSSKVLVGNFGFTGDDGAELLWYSDCYGYVTRGVGTSGFETKFVDVYGLLDATCDAAAYIPLLGDFNGDNKGDIFWYGPGVLDDILLLLGGGLWDIAQLFTQRKFAVPGDTTKAHKPIVADFNGDGRSDIFWYQPGSGADPLWLFDSSGNYTSVNRTVFGDYAPIAGDFNTDGCDDILWFDAPDNELHIWRSNCDGNFTTQTSHTDMAAESYPVGYGIGF